MNVSLGKGRDFMTNMVDTAIIALVFDIFKVLTTPLLLFLSCSRTKAV